MTTATEPGIAPGVYTAEQVPADAYHADPALSSTGARRLLECPAKFAYEREHGQPYKAEFEFGTAAHQLVLGAGPELVCVDYDTWRTAAARAEREEVRAAGGVALLPHEYDQVQAMADAIRADPAAGPLFTPGRGRPEVSLFWTDPDTGVDLRARLDWLMNPRPGHRLIVADYKSARSASPQATARAVAEYGYHQQAAHYLDGVRACGLAGIGASDIAFLLVFQEKDPPYVVTTAYLTPSALIFGAARNHRARQIYRECTASGIWPGYSTEPIPLALPAWAEIRDEEYL